MYVKEGKEEGGSLFFLLSLGLRACVFFFKSQEKTKNKTKKTFPHYGVRSWLAFPESLRFQVFSLFLVFHNRTRCTAKSIRSQEDKKKNFPLLFLIFRDCARCTEKSIRSQGRQQSETKTKKI